MFVAKKLKLEFEKNSFQIACFEGNLNDIEFFVKKIGVDFSFSESESTPLIMAASIGRDDIVDFLLESKADVSKRNCFGHTALNRAVTISCERIIKTLLLSGADSNSKDNCGRPILWFATNINVAKLLISFGADPKFEYSEEPLLFLAVKQNSYELAKYYMTFGLNPHKKNRFGETPFIYAVKTQSFEIAKLWFQEHTLYESEILLKSILEFENKSIFRFIISNNIKPTVKLGSCWKKEFLENYKSKMLFLALARESPKSPFYKDKFPLDLLKVIANLMKFFCKENDWNFLYC